MSTSPTRVLAGALWIQAALLLVLTSILADSDAWIGVIVTGLGLFLVASGIVAAHKRRIGFLYCYATLVGLWEILALTHILVICGLIILPPTVSPAYVVGQKVIRNPADPMKIVMPLLYGLQWGGWCITLVCLASSRLSTRDTTMSLEIQRPKRPHSLEAGSSQSSHGGSPRMNQHFFNFRQSVISPMGGAFAGAGATTYGERGGFSSTSRSRNSGEGSSRPRTYKGKDIVAGQYPNDIDILQMPERVWVGKERRASSDSNAFYIPNDRRISQVVVTFRDDAIDGDQLTQHRSVYSSQPHPLSVAGPSRSQKPEATTVYIASHNYGVNATGDDALGGSNVKGASDTYTLNLSTPGESLSDMIFKPPQNVNQPSLPPMSTPALDSPPHVEHVVAVQEHLGLQGNAEADMPNPARIRSTTTKASLTLSSDSSSSELSALSVVSNSDGEESEKVKVSADGYLKTVSGSCDALGREDVIAGLSMVSVTPLNIIPKVDIQREGDATENTDQETTEPVNKPIQTLHNGSRESPVVEENAVGEEHPSVSSPYASADGSSEFRPQAQPNSSDSSPSLSSLSSFSSRREARCEVGARRDYTENESVFPRGLDSSELLDSASASTSAPTSAPAPAPAPASASASAPAPASFSSSSVIASASSGPTSMTTSPSGPRPKSNIVSLPLNYWRSRQFSSSSSSHKVESSVSSAPSFSQGYITSTFSKKKKPIIPTIVIHPDEEDGGPPRVLSQKDIDYLSTMPPPPLRPLIQPWDDIPEEDEYDDEMTNEGRGHADYNHQNHDYDHRREFYDYNIKGDEDYEVEIDYALDTPIDLDV